MIELRLDCDPVPWSAPIKGKHGFYDKKSKEKGRRHLSKNNNGAKSHKLNVLLQFR